MRKISKILALVLALGVLFVACKKAEPVAPIEQDTRLAAEAFPTDTELFNPDTYNQESDDLYNEIMGEFVSLYDEAKAADNLSERWAKMALAEGKMLGRAMFVPDTTRGGNYAISRVVPRSISTVLYGNDSNRFGTALVATEFLKAEDREALKELWRESAGSGEYLAKAKAFLADHGYTLKDTYDLAYTTDPQTWDVHNTYRSADTEKIWPTTEGLLYYDAENVQQPGLATEWSVSEDGLVYTFKIREGVTWVDSQGRYVADLTADDFVAGMQHLLDAKGGLESLVAGDACTIAGAPEYLAGETTDFSTVGVKAIDDYTLEYTLAEPCSYFTTMLSYNMFAPLSRTYYESLNGKFGAEFDGSAADYNYGKSPDTIAYVGAYLIQNYTRNSTITYVLNDSYWNKDAMNITKCTWKYNDGSDATKAYRDAKAGTTDGTGLNTEGVVACKNDGLFDDFAYVSDTDATTYCGFLNVNRKAFANFNDASQGISTKTVYDAKRATLALQNVHFRRAFLASLDRGTLNAQTVGEDLKYNSLRNSYVPGTFVTLPEDVTVKVNGKDVTFPAGTDYGMIVQAQLDADGVAIKAYDVVNGTSDGYDGYYNPEFAAAELDKAISELAEKGVEISEENPIYIDLGYYSASQTNTNRANALKYCVEATTGGKVIINLVAFDDQYAYYYAGYYPDYGYEMNADYTNMSGWGPDYGDPQTYLDTLLGNPGGMIKSCGLY